VFGGLFPLFPLLQSNETFGFSFATGAVGEGLLQPTATSSDATVREARRRLMIRSPMLGGGPARRDSCQSLLRSQRLSTVCGGREWRPYEIGVSWESETD